MSQAFRRRPDRTNADLESVRRGTNMISLASSHQQKSHQYHDSDRCQQQDGSGPRIVPCGFETIATRVTPHDILGHDASTLRTPLRHCRRLSHDSDRRFNFGGPSISFHRHDLLQCLLRPVRARSRVNSGRHGQSRFTYEGNSGRSGSTRTEVPNIEGWQGNKRGHFMARQKDSSQS